MLASAKTRFMDHGICENLSMLKQLNIVELTMYFVNVQVPVPFADQVMTNYLLHSNPTSEMKGHVLGISSLLHVNSLAFTNHLI